MAVRKTKSSTFLFDPRGRINGLVFVLGNFGAFVLTLVWGLLCAAVLTVIALVAHLQRDSLAMQALLFVTVALIVVPVLWWTVALAAKRFRDAGLPVIAMSVFMFAFPWFDSLVLTRLTEARFLAPFDRMTPVGGGVMAIVYLALIFLPSRKTAAPVADVFA